jgi:hypothetical protein
LAERDIDARAVRGTLGPRRVELGCGYPELTGIERPLRAAQNLLAILRRGSGGGDEQGC